MTEAISKEPQAIGHLLVSVMGLLLIQLASLTLPVAELARQIQPHSLSTHNLMEGVSIVISASVFAVGWSVYQKENSGGFVVMACCFLGVALLDFLHTLSFKGMPAFVSESGAEKAIAFWLMARGLAAVGLIACAVPCKRLLSPAFRWSVLVCVIGLCGVGAWLVFFHQARLPATFDETSGLTPFKKNSEYLLAALYGLIAVVFVYQARWRRNCDAAGLAAAAAVMAMSELFVTFYTSVADLYILLGHVYKVFAYAFIYRSIFVSSVQRPYQRLFAAHQALSASETKFHAIIDESPVAYVVYDTQGRIDYLNPAFVKIFGYDRSDIPSLAEWWWLAHPDAEYRQQVIGRWHEYRRLYDESGELSPPQELAVRAKNGSLHTVLVNNVVLDNTPAATNFLMLHDVSDRVEAMRRLAESVDMLQTVIDTIPSRVFWKDLDSRYLGANIAFSRDAGLAGPEQLIGKLDSELAWRDFGDKYRADDLQVIRSNAPKLDYEEAQIDPHGNTVWLKTSKVPLRDAQRRPIGVLGVYDDITARKLAEQEMQLASLVYLNSSEAMLVTDGSGLIITVNPAFTKVTGYAADEVIGRSFTGLSPEQHDQAFFKTVLRVTNTQGHWAGEIGGRRKNGDDCVHWVTVNSIYNETGGVHRRVALITDITERKKSEQLIWRQANFDPLTSLPNRNMFLDRLDREIKKALRHSQKVALMFLDLDRFKDVNDSLGHFMGDVLLKEAAHRLSESVRDSDSIARLGGDEFTIILGELEHTESVDRIADSILQRLAQPFSLGNEIAYISASIGIAVFPDDGNDSEALLKNADQAMYAAKNQGRDRYQYFTAQMQLQSQKRLRLANDLHAALAKNQLLLHYQPIVDFGSGRLAKAEALLRWQHPDLGMVSPAEFIPIAEDTGSIVEIGDWVFADAVRQLKQWRELYQPQFQISVNKSPVQFRKQALESQAWVAVLQELGLPGDSVVVEITEGALLEASDASREQLLVFRDAGIQVALDDFGTGYSSLAYLKKFDIDYIKIDQTFVRNMVAESSDMALCEAIVVMAHKLGIKVVAEGIETAEQYQLLRRIGCDYGQGYLISKPVPAEQFERLFATGIMVADAAG
ncbi:EAL domain-containing protein [Methylomonas koyamae]|uniref:bifunctional diguanylate cyclase/phosphodiesterase n=1 Tax=Methylomonas koyamae TaxID=702114 RepID=UPI00112CE771|nr:EAL domain-containing protein [Methylomonas koyamae]TPQ28657.1 hypothetical protein C2U68_04135 [Methylomonas koyamae]